MRVIGIPIVQGRTFSEAEIRSDTTTALIVTESTARRLWPDQNALGQTLLMGLPGGERPVEVVGVARDVQVARISETDTSYVYSPAVTPTQAGLQLVIRSSLDAAALDAGVQAIVASLDAGLVASARPSLRVAGSGRRPDRPDGVFVFSRLRLGRRGDAVGEAGRNDVADRGPWPFHARAPAAVLGGRRQR